MRILKYFIGLLILTSLFLSFIPFINTTLALDDINYTFKNDIFYENNSIDNNFVEYNNVKNMTTFTNTYNATHSFTNEIDGTNSTNIDYIDFDVSAINTGVIIIETLESHDKVIEFFDNNNSGLYDCINGFIAQASGTIEWFWRTTDSNKGNQLIFREGITRGPRIQIDVNNFQYYSGGQNNIISALSNTWYHIRLDFECGGGGYLGLAPDEFFITINGVQYGPFDFNVATDNLDNVWITSINADTGYSQYIDAIGYTWNFYNINDNLAPLENIDTKLLEIDKYTFTFDSVGNTMSAGTDNPSGWTDIESGADRVNTALNDSGTKELVVQIFSSVGADSNNSLFKNDFNLNSERLNITLGLFFPTLTGTLTRFNFEVKSLSNSLVVWFEIRATGHLRWYTSNPPGTFITLRTNLTVGIYYEFNIYIDYSTDISVLRLKENLVHTGTFINKLTNIGKTGLKSILATATYTDGNIISEIDYIGIYDNGSSIAKDLGYVVLDLHKDSHYLNSIHNNLATINMSGNFELIYASYIGPPFPIYLLDSAFGSITDGFVIMNENSRLFNFYDDGTIRFDPLLVAFLNNGSKGFKFNSVILEGAKMTEGSNTYWLEYSHSNILTNTSFFKVDNSNRLTFNLTANDSDLEFIQANFNINNVQTLDRAVSFQSKKNNLAYGELRLLYPTVSDIIEIPNDIGTSRTIISQNQTLTEFIFLFSDNDITAINGITSGYIKNLRLDIISNLSTTIITLTLLGMIIPLILIITPTFIFSNRLGKESVVPLFLIFSLIFTATETIPIWLFFIIAFSSLVFIFTNKDKMVK